MAHRLVFGAFGYAIGAVLSPGVIFYPIAIVVAYMVSFGAALLTGALVRAIAPFLPRGRAI